MYEYWVLLGRWWGEGRGLKLKTGMVVQLGREVCNIWYYVARKNMTWLKAILYMQSEKKRCWGIMLKKLKRGLRACRLKWGGTSCDIKQSKNVFVAKL